MQNKPFEAMNHEFLEKKFSDYFPGGSEGNQENEGKEGEEGEEGNQGGNLLYGLRDVSQSINFEVLAAGLPRQDSEQTRENKLSSNPSFNKNDFIFFLRLQACIDWHCYGIQTILKEEKEEKEEKLTYRLYRKGPDQKGSDQKGHGLGGDDYLHLNAIMRLHHLICALEYFKSHWEVSSQENNNNSPSQPLNDDVPGSQENNFREKLKSFIKKDRKALPEEQFNQALHDDLKAFCGIRSIDFNKEVGKSQMLNILKILGTVLYPKPEVITKINDEFFHRLIPVTKKTEDQKTNQDQDQGQETKIDNYIESLSNVSLSKVSFLYAALTAFKRLINQHIQSLSGTSFICAALTAFRILIKDDTRALGAQARKIFPETAKNAWLVELIFRGEEINQFIRHAALACASVQSSDRGEATRNLNQIKQYSRELHGINLNTRVGPFGSVADSIFGLNQGQNTIVDQTEAAFGEGFINIGQNFLAAFTGNYFFSTENNDCRGKIFDCLSWGKAFDFFSYLFFIARIIYIPVCIGSLETVIKIIIGVVALIAFGFIPFDVASILSFSFPVCVGMLGSYIQSDLSSSTIETVMNRIWIVALCDAVFNLSHAVMAQLYLRGRLGEIVKQELIPKDQKTIATISCASGQDRTSGAALLFELIKSLGIAQAQAQAQAHKMLASASALIANFSSPGAHGVKKQSDLGILPRTVREFLYNEKPSNKNKDPELPATCGQKFLADKWAYFHVCVCLFEFVFFLIRYLDDTHSHDYFKILNEVSDVWALIKSAGLLCVHALVSKSEFKKQSMFLGVSFFLSFVFYVYFLSIKGGEQVEEILPIVATLLCGNFQMDHFDVMTAPCVFTTDNPSREQEVSDSLTIVNQTSFGLDDAVWDPAALQFLVRCTEFNHLAFTLLWLNLSGQDMSLEYPAVNISGRCGINPWPVEGEVVCEDVVQPSGQLPCDVKTNATDAEDVQGFKDAVVSHGGIGSGATMVWSSEHFAFWVMCSTSQGFNWRQSFVSSDPHYQLNATEVPIEGQCPQQDLSALTF